MERVSIGARVTAASGLRFPGTVGDWCAFVLLLAALLVFVGTGAARGLHFDSDFSWNYMATRAWLLGRDPYSVGAYAGTSSGDFPQASDVHGAGTPYPPAVFPVSFPFVLSSWPVAEALMLVFSLALLALAVWRMARAYLADLPPRAALLFVAAVLASYPVLSGLRLLQYAVPAAALALLAVTFDLRARNERHIAAVLAALALAFKPQIGVVAILYGLVLGRWRFVHASASIYLVLTLIGTAPVVMAEGGTAWLYGLASNIRAVGAIQGVDLYCCVNLAAALVQIVPVRAADLIGLVPWVGIPVLVARYARAELDTGEVSPDAKLTILALCGLVLSLSMFVRPYNLILIIPVFALIVRLVVAKPRESISAAKWIVLAASLVFVQPISPLGAENTLVGNSFVDWPPTARAIWVLLIVPAQTYLLLLIFAALLWDALGKVPRTSAPYLARGLER